MAYTTPSAVRRALTADGDPGDASTAASLDDATLTGPCQAAADQIDAYLANRYNVPLANPPALVTDLAADIAAYLATLVFRKGQPVETTDPVWLRYQRAQKLLADLSTGAASIPAVAAGTPQGQVVVSNPVPGPMFTPGDYDLTREPTGDGWGVRRWWGA